MSYFHFSFSVYLFHRQKREERKEKKILYLVSLQCFLFLICVGMVKNRTNREVTLENAIFLTAFIHSVNEKSEEKC